MLIVQVYVTVKPEHLAAYQAAILANAAASRQEPGNLRFDVLHETENPTRFVLVEVYRDEAARQAHWDSDHFKAYREVASYAVESREAKTYTALFPDESAWE
jgi:quinol monooxygenase YgiN